MIRDLDNDFFVYSMLPFHAGLVDTSTSSSVYALQLCTYYVYIYIYLYITKLS